MELNTDVKNRIEYILEHFDFHKVKRVMDALNWGWFMEGGRYSIPTVYDLREEAQRLLMETYEECHGKGNRTHRSRGFRASCLTYPNGFYFELTFEVDRFESYPIYFKKE